MEIIMLKDEVKYSSSKIHVSGYDLVQLHYLEDSHNKVTYDYHHVDGGRLFGLYHKEGGSIKNVSSGSFKYGWLYYIDDKVVVSSEWIPHVDAKAITFLVSKVSK